MRIVLMRHGRPHLPNRKLISAYDLLDWIKTYNRAGIDKTDRPTQAALTTARACRTVVCSDLPRSTESARLLGTGMPAVIEPLFREMELPHGTWRFPQFPPVIWLVLFRALWLLGYAKNGESFQAGQIRASLAARKLTELSRDSAPVLFVGHGLINRLIAQALLADGWKGPKTPGHHYWDVALYELDPKKYEANAIPETSIPERTP